jgi:hypothetical protein
MDVGASGRSKKSLTNSKNQQQMRMQQEKKKDLKFEKSLVGWQGMWNRIS